MIFLSTSSGAVVLQKKKSSEKFALKRWRQEAANPSIPHPSVDPRLANTRPRRRLTRRTLPAEFKIAVKLETKMAWHVPVWALSARRTPYKIGAARGGTTWPPPTNGIDACMFCSAFLRADGDERLGCFQNQPWTSRSYRLRLTPDIEQILSKHAIVAANHHRGSRRQCESQREGELRSGFIHPSLGLQRLPLAIWLSYMEAADSGHANVELTWSKLRAKTECQVLRRLSIPDCHVCYTRLQSVAFLTGLCFFFF